MTPERHYRCARLSRLVPGVLLVLGVLGVLGVVARCGQHSTAAQVAPQVKSALTQVENALAAHQYPVARRGLDALIEYTLTARRSGTLSAEQADRILAAARVKADLPSATPTPRATASRTADEDSGKDTGDEHKNHHGDKSD
jgi:hypothetical protein